MPFIFHTISIKTSLGIRTLTDLITFLGNRIVKVLNKILDLKGLKLCSYYQKFVFGYGFLRLQTPDSKLTDGNGRNDESVSVEQRVRFGGHISAEILQQQFLFFRQSLLLRHFREFFGCCSV